MFATKQKTVQKDGLFLCSGGADQARTDDPLLAKQVLYQLSYNPKTLLFFYCYLLKAHTFYDFIKQMSRPFIIFSCFLYFYVIKCPSTKINSIQIRQKGVNT